MKRILFLLVLSILSMGISFAQIRLGATAGLNASSYNESGGESMSYGFKAGIQAGIIADFCITKKFSVMPELLFSQHGVKYKSYEVYTTLNYLRLPLNLAYKYDIGDGSLLFVFAGPYVGYGLSGNTSSKVKGTKIEFPDINFGSKEDDLKQVDYGINIGIGYEFEKVFFKIQYNHGLSDLHNLESIKRKNVNITISAGYYFL